MFYKLGTSIFGRFLPFSFARPLKLHQVGWETTVCRFLDPSIGCSIGFKSRLWLHHSRTFTELSRSHSFVILAVCLGLFSCWKVNFLPSLRFRIIIINAISIFWCTELFFYSDETPVPATEKLPHSMRLFPAHFTFGIVLCR